MFTGKTISRSREDLTGRVNGMRREIGKDRDSHISKALKAHPVKSVQNVRLPQGCGKV